ncbi:hypothetical protein EJB05_48534 [Eragrostis curvula]|uniref:Uncharacterized protein n=1 Tax=Eragrostis curvula TaxID=38414 RepID=A0A5J9T224_9POAL|nr:hypothetical protein EJB05_48534 [Eragrostis curvula]
MCPRRAFVEFHRRRPCFRPRVPLTCCGGSTAFTSSGSSFQPKKHPPMEARRSCGASGRAGNKWAGVAWGWNGFVLPHKNSPTIAPERTKNNPKNQPRYTHSMAFLPPTPGCKNTLKHFSHQIPLSRLEEQVEIVMHLIHLPEIHQEPQATVLELRQAVQMRGLEPFEYIARVNVLQQALMACLLEVGDVILVGSPEESQPVGEELFAVQIAIDEVEEGLT